MLTLDNHFISTYAKNYLSDWSVIKHIIKQQTTWVKDIIHASDNENHAITDQQINDALNGPFQLFFKSHLRAYALLTKIETALTFTKDDTFKESDHMSDITLGISKYILDTTEFSTVQALRAKLDELTNTHYAQWETEIKNWTDLLLPEFKLLPQFKKNKLLLSENEIQDFSINQPLSEIHERLTELKIAIPKLSKSDFDFPQYFTLKATIAIQNALSRMQQPHTEKEIEEELKALKAPLKSIAHAEQTIIEMQQKALDDLLLPMTVQ